MDIFRDASSENRWSGLQNRRGRWCGEFRSGKINYNCDQDRVLRAISFFIKVQGDNESELDFGAVQRGDAEMEQKLNRLVRACMEMGKNNPILSIHDQGAGGNGKRCEKDSQFVILKTLLKINCKILQQFARFCKIYKILCCKFCKFLPFLQTL